jgi:molybdopterin-synthase adenylyltransferase
MPFRLHHAWNCRASQFGLELFSFRLRSRLLIKMSKDTAIILMDLFTGGFGAGDAVAEISKYSGFPEESSKAIFSKLRDVKAIIFTTDIERFTEETFDRQAIFFDLFETDKMKGVDYDRRLRKARVLLVGVGGYGSILASLCARAGIGELVLIDNDKVERTNLNRQIFFDQRHIGKYKVDVAAEALSEISSSVRIQSFAGKVKKRDDVAKHLRSNDLVFNAFGYEDSSLCGAIELGAQDANAACLTFTGSWIGPLTRNGQDPCRECWRSTIYPRPEYQAAISNMSSSNKRLRRTPSFGPRIATSTSIAAWEAIRHLAGLDTPPTTRGIVMIDTFDYFNHSFFKIHSRTGCPYCGRRGKS